MNGLGRTYWVEPGYYFRYTEPDSQSGSDRRLTDAGVP